MMSNDPNAVERAFQELMGKLTSIAGDVVSDDNEHMETPLTRPELDAKLETIEAKMDGRLSRMEAIADRIGDDVRETRRDIKTLKTTVITTAIIAALTIVFGIAGFNAMLTSNMLSAFQAGQQVSQQK